MAATHALFDWEFSEVENKPDDAIVEVIDHKEFDLEKMKYEIEDLKVALAAANVALITERDKHAKDRDMYEMEIEDIKSYCNKYFEKLVNENEAKLKQLDEDYGDNLQKLQEYRDQPLPRTASASTQCQTLSPLTVRCTEDGNVADDERDEEAAPANEDNDKVLQLKRRVAELTFTNNRYHLALSNCTFCVSDNDDSTIVSTCDKSIRASTPLSNELSSSGSDQALSPGTIPSLMSLKTEDRRQAKVNTTVEKKDKTFISRMIKTVAKLEIKYATPEHKRKKRLFTRKRKTCSIVPKEFASIYNDLAAPEPETGTIPDLNPPQVDWSKVRFKPSLPNPMECTVYSCSQNPKTYEDDGTPWSAPFHGRNPFGTLLGYMTTEGAVAVPSTPISGYVYSIVHRQWILHASLPKAGRGTRKGGGTSFTRRKKG